MQQIQPTTANTTSGQAPIHPVNAAQGPINPNEGAFEQTVPHTNNVNHGVVQQTSQNTNSSCDVSGQSSQASVDQSIGGSVQDFQPVDIADQNLFLNQIDGTNHSSPDAAAIQNQGVEVPQSQADTSDAWMQFAGSDAMDGLNFDFSFDPLQGSSVMDGLDLNFVVDAGLQGDSTMTQEAVNPQQDFPHQGVPQQPSQHQPSEEESVQQQSMEGANAQQVSNSDDMFADLNYEDLAAYLEPLVRFNAEN